LSGIIEDMAQPTTPTPQDKVINLKGLPEKEVEAVRAFVEMLRRQDLAQPPISPDEWRKRFSDYLQEVASRAARYPDGFIVDDSRETMYEGCGE
jgi:hypothetical protein